MSWSGIKSAQTVPKNSRVSQFFCTLLSQKWETVIIRYPATVLLCHLFTFSTLAAGISRYTTSTTSHALKGMETTDCGMSVCAGQPPSVRRKYWKLKSLKYLIIMWKPKRCDKCLFSLLFYSLLLIPLDKKGPAQHLQHGVWRLLRCAAGRKSWQIPVLHCMSACYSRKSSKSCPLNFFRSLGFPSTLPGFHAWGALCLRHIHGKELARGIQTHQIGVTDQHVAHQKARPRGEASPSPWVNNGWFLMSASNISVFSYHGI